MHGGREPSGRARAFVVLNHAAALGLAAWLLFHGRGDAARRAALLACAAVYFARTCATLLHLLKRTVPAPEAAAIAAMLYAVQAGFAAAGGASAAALGPADGIALGLYAAGSFLNTASETARLRWKSLPENEGRLYTRGLFSLSRHINYFGDVVLFLGWALLTRTAWCLLVPAAMSLGFVLVNIPLLERHLSRRYGAEFEAYRARTKSFVPYLF